jgi:hypothetical protein
MLSILANFGATMPVTTPAMARHSNYFGHPALREPAKLFKFVPDEFVACCLRHGSDTLWRPNRGSNLYKTELIQTKKAE